MNAQQTLAPDGSFLPSTLARLKAENSYILHDVARDLGELVSGITTLEIEEDASRNRYVMYATTQDGRKFSSRILSDGTLRLLALITLDPGEALDSVPSFVTFEAALAIAFVELRLIEPER